MYVLFYIIAGIILLAALVSLVNDIAITSVYVSLFLAFLFFAITAHKTKKHASKQNKEYDKNVKVIADIGSRLVEVINESLKMANDSKNPDTKVSRLNVAKDKLEELKKLEKEYGFIHIQKLGEVESTIKNLELEFETAGHREIAQGNMSGELLEKEGNIDGAIEIYEGLLASKVDTPFTYRRLAILYRKRKQKNDEVRVIKAALNNVPSSNDTHYKWFAERLSKMV